jgi:protease-4
VQIQAANEVVTDIYDDFVSIVADGRGMSIEAVDKIARGRVWTGADALEIGLVDRIATLEEAIEEAANRAGLTEDYGLVYLPKLQNPLDAIIEDLMGVSYEGVDAAKFAAEMLATLGLDEGAAEDLELLQQLLRSGDRMQARMPYVLRID